MRSRDSDIAGLKYPRPRRTDVASSSSSLLDLDPIAYFAMGGFALFFGLFFLVFLWDIPLFLYLCGPVTFIPGVIALTIGILQWRRERAVLEFAEWVKSQRRVKMDLMAQRIGKTRYETERLLGKALAKGFVKGAIDRTTDEFVLEEAVKQEHFVGQCPHCGGNVDTWYFIQISPITGRWWVARSIVSAPRSVAFHRHNKNIVTPATAAKIGA